MKAEECMSDSKVGEEMFLRNMKQNIFTSKNLYREKWSIIAVATMTFQNGS